MYITNVSLVKFYRRALPAAASARYKLVLTALAREADSSAFYKDAKRYWSSLHDLTGNDILFIFSGANVARDLPSSSLQGNLAYVSNHAAVVDANSLFWQESATLRRGNPYLLPHEDECLERDHTLEISDLRHYLNIAEAQLPCFVITLLFSEGTSIYPHVVSSFASLASRTVYEHIKSLVESCESAFREVDAARLVRRKAEQRLVDFERPFRELLYLRSDIETKSQNLSSPSVREAVVEILMLCAQAGRADHERMRCYQHFQVVRKEHDSQTGIIPQLQRLIDRSFLSRGLESTSRDALLDQQTHALRVEREIWARLRSTVEEAVAKTAKSDGTLRTSVSNPVGSSYSLFVRDAFVRFYPDIGSVHRVMHDARVDSRHIAFGGSITTLWHEVILEAQKQGRYESLLAVIRREYPRAEV